MMSPSCDMMPNGNIGVSLGINARVSHRLIYRGFSLSASPAYRGTSFAFGTAVLISHGSICVLKAELRR